MSHRAFWPIAWLASVFVLAAAGCSSGAVTASPTLAGTPVATPSPPVPPTAAPSPTLGVTTSPTASPTETPTQEPTTLSDANQALIHTWLKGKGTPAGGYVDMHTLRPLPFGWIYELPSVNPAWTISDSFQELAITGQQIGSNYYVFGGFLRSSKRYFVAFDAGAAATPISEHFIAEMADGGNQWVNSQYVSTTVLSVDGLAKVMPQLTGHPNVVDVNKNLIGNHVAPYYQTDAQWTDAHHHADAAFINWLKSGATQPSFVDEIPNMGDNPNTFPAFSEFHLPLAELIQP
jgi:hypothetical protein